MSELSALLKQARIAKGYTIDKLHKITKIPVEVIVALESGNFEDISNLHHTKVYIKKYARHVDLDPSELMEEYEGMLELYFEEDEVADEDEDGIEEEDEIDDEEEIPSRFDRHHITGNQPIWSFLIKYLPVIGLVAIILGIMGTIIVTINRINSENNEEVAVEQSITSDEVISSVEPDSSQEVQSSNLPEDTPAPQEQSTDLVLLSDDPEPTVYEVNSLGALSMTLEGLNTVWVGYFEDGALVEEYVLNAGDKVEIAPNDVQSATLQFGYKEGVNLTVNNQEIPLTNVTQPNHIEFVTKQGAEQRSPDTLDESEESNDTTSDETEEETPAQEEPNNAEESYQGPAVLDPNYTPGSE